MSHAKLIWISWLAIACVTLISYTSVQAYTYFTTTTIEDVRKQNEAFEKAKSELLKARVEYCNDTSTGKIDYDSCGEFLNKSLNAKATTGSVIPEARRPDNKSISLECEWWEIKKIEWIEFHYTATHEETTLQAIKNGHTKKYGSEHIWYHYVIKPNGEITNTRDTKCVAWADKWSKNNYRFIQIAFVWDDKPTHEQADSMARLAKSMQIKYNLPIDAVSAHSDWWPKSKKESLENWFWSKDEFIKKIRYFYVISIYWNESEELQYMWRAWWDVDFIGTIFQESRMNNKSVGDGWNSIWYCQIHKWLQPWWYSAYKSLETMQERLNYCHELYTYAKWLKGGVGSRFHWFDAREKHIKNIVTQ